MKHPFAERLHPCAYRHTTPYYYKTPEIAFAVASPCIAYEAAFFAPRFEETVAYAPNTTAWD